MNGPFVPYKTHVRRITFNGLKKVEDKWKRSKAKWKLCAFLMPFAHSNQLMRKAWWREFEKKNDDAELVKRCMKLKTIALWTTGWFLCIIFFFLRFFWTNHWYSWAFSMFYISLQSLSLPNSICAINSALWYCNKYHKNNIRRNEE